MRRAALILAVAFGAGCLFQSRTDTGRADLYWTFWSESLGNIGAFTDTGTLVCTAAGVYDVKLTFTTPDGSPVEPSYHRCTSPNDVPGAAFTGLSPGTWGYLLEARRGGVVVFEQWGTFQAADGTRTQVEARAVPPAGNWDVIASYTTGPCNADDRVDFDLFSTAGGVYAKAFSTRDPAINPRVSLPCGSGTIHIPSVAPGPYEFSDWVHVGASGGVPVEYGVCRAAWTQPNDANVTKGVTVTALGPAPAGNPGICL